MRRSITALMVIVWIICGILAFGFAKYNFVERYHYHGNLSYEEVWGIQGDMVFGVSSLLGGPVALVSWSVIRFIEDLDGWRPFPHSFVGFMLTEEMAYPKYHDPEDPRFKAFWIHYN